MSVSGRLRAALVSAVCLVLIAGVTAPGASADGDPGSDVLVSQSLFMPADAGVGIREQTQLASLLSRARARGFPVRVAVIPHADDLGAVTELWKQPTSYAQFLGVELSLAFKGPLLVVMPDGFGFRWVGHAAAVGTAARALARIRIAPGAGLAAATGRALTTLTDVAGVRPVRAFARPARPASSGATGALAVAGSAASGAQGGPTILSAGHGVTGTLVIFAVGVALLTLVVRWLVVRAGAPREDGGGRRRLRPRVSWVAPVTAILAAVAPAVLLTLGPHGSSSASAGGLSANPNLDPGQALAGGPAPDFTLFDQFGRRMTLRQYRGKVVLLAFNDSECTTICPLTTTAMLDAKRLLGAAGRKVQLLGVDADVKETQVQDVLSYSELHGLTHAWRFGTGTLPELKSVWRAYHVEAAVNDGLISHTPALFVIDPQGRERALYLTHHSYAAVPQLGELLAQEAASLLPGHPPVAQRVSYRRAPSIRPAVRAELPRAGGGTVRIGPGSDRLYVFFDTWDQEVMPIGGDLDALNGYARAAARSGLPGLTGIDEASVEPSASALPRFLHGLASPPAYPIAIDNTGEVADGYGVRGEPWLVLTSAHGKILWYRQPDTQGWPTTGRLKAEIGAALGRGGTTPPASQAAAHRRLRGSPPVLAALHRQAGRLLGGESALAARIRALRGHPIVVNVWASWCAPCRDEFGLLARASVRYGRSVAFLGVDYHDSAGDAVAFLRAHPVSYPSYQAQTGQLSSLLTGGLEGTPTTFYITAGGHVSSVHIGAYRSTTALDADIQADAHAPR